jgi:hypothetical protein
MEIKINKGGKKCIYKIRELTLKLLFCDLDEFLNLTDFNSHVDSSLYT